MAKVVDIPPAFSFFRSMQNENIELVTCLSELVDNAMGAHATHVVIDYSGPTLTVTDDGVGEEDLRVFFQIGASGTRKRSSSDPQRYGVGLANVFASMGDELYVSTTHNGIERTGWTSAAIMEEAQRFILMVEDEKESSGVGTTVQIRNIDKRRFVQSGNDIIVREIGMTYYPALSSGTRIEYRKKSQNIPIRAWARPKCRDKVEKRIDLGRNRTVDVSAGIIQDGEQAPPRGAFIVTYGPRVIEMSSGYARQYFTTGFFCELKLDGRGWKLQKNKRGLMPEERRDLEEAVFGVFEPVLAKCSQKSQDINLGDIGLKVSDRLFSDAPIHKRQQSEVVNAGLTRPVPLSQRGPQRLVTRENRREDGDKVFRSGFRKLSKCSVGAWPGATRDMPPYRAECSQQYLKLMINTSHPYFAGLMHARSKPVLEAMVYGVASFERACYDAQAKAPLFGMEELKRMFMANLGRAPVSEQADGQPSEESA